MKPHFLLLIAAGLLALGIFKTPLSKAATPLYPDLRTLPPTDLQFDEALIDDVPHQVLRFSTVIWNTGQGPLELRAESPDDRTYVFQRVYDEGGGFTEQPAGEFVFHPAHNHWHFEQFADYELWRAAEYAAWLASGGQQGQPGWLGSKTTGQGESVCLRDSYRVKRLPGTPRQKVYSTCGRDIQGISVGYGDEYSYDLPDQWVDLGDSRLADGEYVLRLVADPSNRLWESAAGSDPARESVQANEYVTFFTVREGRIEVSPSPAGRG